MSKKYNGPDSEAQYYKQVKRRSIWGQVMLAVVFFAAIGLVILVSYVRHQKKIEAGGADLTQEATVIDYMANSVGSIVYENTDELDQSYGDYFYLGMDFYELDKEAAIEIYDHVGTVIFTGGETVETFCWTCDDAEVTQEEVDTMASELAPVYGDYEKDADGTYVWTASGDDVIGERENLGRISLGLDDAGVLVIAGEARE